MLRALVIEDDINLSATINKGLVRIGYQVDCIYDGLEARLANWSQYDIIILDWNLPRLSGIDLLRIKRESKWFGVCIMLTAHSEILDKIAGLDFGADDYICKPFDWGEFYSRIRACIRRRYGFGTTTLEGLEWDRDKQVFYENNQPVNLTETEYHILTLFFSYPAKIYTKNDIIDKIYTQKDIYPDSNVIERHISKLRKKFLYDPIQTIQNFGYRLRSNPVSKK
jgi:DNA-binding response OmpR family regulator